MQEKDLEHIWRKPAYLPFVQPALTDAAIEAAEASLGFKLPKAYLDLLRVQNGGYIRFKLEEIEHSIISGIGPGCPNILDNAWAEHQKDMKFPFPGLVPFDSEDSWCLCFDYRKNSDLPCITYFDSEKNSEHIIAENFESYLRLLSPDTQNEFIISPAYSLGETVDYIGRILDLQFEGPNTEPYGHPYYWAAYEEKTSIWISANKVRAGYIHTFENPYKELDTILIDSEIQVTEFPQFGIPHESLKHLLDVWTVRFPEIPEQSQLMSFSQTPTEDIFEKLAQNGILIKALKDML